MGKPSLNHKSTDHILVQPRQKNIHPLIKAQAWYSKRFSPVPQSKAKVRNHHYYYFYQCIMRVFMAVQRRGTIL